MLANSEMASADEASRTETFFGFHIGSVGLLAGIEQWCEVIEQTQAFPIPNTQPWFGGLVNLRGNLVPAIDLRRLFGDEPNPAAKRRLLAIGKGDKAVALWIDGLPEVLDIAPHAVAPPQALPTELAPHVHAAYRHQGQHWLHLRFDELFKTLGRHVALS